MCDALPHAQTALVSQTHVSLRDIKRYRNSEIAAGLELVDISHTDTYFC